MNAVDLALVLAVDGSASVTYDEFNLTAGAWQRRCASRRSMGRASRCCAAHPAPSVPLLSLVLV
jgi:hypothetical protein